MSISVIFFKSKFCSACQQIEPVYKSALGNYPDVKSEIVDITENLKAAIDNGVMSVPTVIFFKNDKEAVRLSGLISKEKIEQTIKENL